MGNPIKFVLFFTFVVILIPDSTNGACCGCSGGFAFGTGLCRDRTPCTPCCGYRRCNFFCCNCECRTRNRSNFYGSVGSPDGFESIDLNGNGFVDKIEARSFLSTGSCGNSTEKLADFEEGFAMHDINGDGVLSYDEIDSED